jgi:predicted nucleic acid-binding protein
LIFLDTNVVSEIMRPEPHATVVAWLENHESDLALSTVVIAEISSGIERIRLAERAPRLAGAFASARRRFAMRIHAFDEESALIYGSLIGEAARKGHPAAVTDGMIAAIALRHRATLATRNTADFGFFSLQVVNPWG